MLKKIIKHKKSAKNEMVIALPSKISLANRVPKASEIKAKKIGLKFKTLFICLKNYSIKLQ